MSADSTAVDLHQEGENAVQSRWSVIPVQATVGESTSFQNVLAAILVLNDGVVLSLPAMAWAVWFAIHLNLKKKGAVSPFCTWVVYYDYNFTMGGQAIEWAHLAFKEEYECVNFAEWFGGQVDWALGQDRSMNRRGVEGP